MQKASPSCSCLLPVFICNQVALHLIIYGKQVLKEALGSRSDKSSVIPARTKLPSSLQGGERAAATFCKETVSRVLIPDTSLERPVSSSQARCTLSSQSLNSLTLCAAADFIQVPHVLHQMNINWSYCMNKTNPLISGTVVFIFKLSVYNSISNIVTIPKTLWKERLGVSWVIQSSPSCHKVPCSVSPFLNLLSFILNSLILFATTTSLKGCFRTSYYGQFILIYSCANIVLQFKQLFSLPAVLFSPAPFPTPTSKFVENNHSLSQPFSSWPNTPGSPFAFESSAARSAGTSHGHCLHLFWQEFPFHT